MAIKHATLLDHYLWHMADSIAKVEDSEDVYAAVVQAHHDKFGAGVIADQKAATHPDLQQAVGDGGFYRDRAQTYALGAIALMLHEQHYPQGGAR
jgi:hypothetical protein